MNKLNQKGMSSILFAMVFIIILSLIGVGFATLVRKDQRETLDKTLSFQAQYAAETAINRKAAELQGLSAESTSTTDCATELDINDAANSNAAAKVTCIQWTNVVNSLKKDNLGTDPFVVNLTPQSGSFNRIVITWADSNPAKVGTYASGATLPNISTNNVPILRLTLAQATAIDSVATVYLIPLNGGSGLLSPGWANGDTSEANCSAGICTADISMPAATGPSTASLYFSVIAYGGSGSADIQSITIHNGAGPSQKLVGSQAIIDANARALDVTKRVRAVVSLETQTWNPSFGVSADKICKDFRVDGDQTVAASAAASPVCY